MPFYNRVRLPFKITRPQFLEERDIFRKANGVIEVLSSVIRKQYEGETDLLPERLHERLKIALSHDNVNIEGEKYVGNIVQDGDYTIAWVDFLDYPIAKATFKVLVTPFDATNANCGECADEFIQVEAVDDNAGTRAEGASFSVDVLANDDVCCDPAVLSVVSFNTTYVQSMVVDVDNTISVVLNTPLITQNGVLLGTYRVTCNNNQFDEANIYADITGTDEGCLAPQVGVGQIESDEATAIVVPPNPAPSGGYQWELRIGLTVVDSGTVGFNNIIHLTGLTPSTQYTLYVRSNCGGGEFSNYVATPFITDPPDQSQQCGSYSVYYEDPEARPTDVANVTYIDCNGENEFLIVPNYQYRQICALQNNPGDPVKILAGDPITITYLGLC